MAASEITVGEFLYEAAVDFTEVVEYGVSLALAGFAIRGRQLVVYLVPEGDRQKFLLSKLGKHNIGKSCLYFKKLADLDPSVLEQLVAGSVAEVRRRYG